MSRSTKNGSLSTRHESIQVVKDNKTQLQDSISAKEHSIELTQNKQEISILNEKDEIEILNFSSNEMLEMVQLEDSTVEVIGFIDEIDGPKIVGKAQHYRLLKFLLNNNNKHRIQIVAWNTEIERIKHHLQPNRIIHIDGAKARKPKVADFNHGTLPYELIIRSNTIINNLGIFNLKTKIDAVKPKLINISNIPEYLDTCILINGFIKTNFNTFTNNSKSYGYGSITDGTYKLEVQITNYEHENYYKKRDHVQIKGYVKVANEVFYLEVENMSDIKVSNEKSTISFAQCLQGTKPITKRTYSDNITELPKKIFCT